MRKLVLSLLLITILNSCGQGEKYTTPEEYQHEISDLKIEPNVGPNIGPNLIPIQSGKFTMGAVEQGFMHDWNNTPRTMTVESFYIDETEVTNYQYRQYLNWTKKVFPPSDDLYKYIYPSALPDTLAWRKPTGYYEKYVNLYLRHPAYDNYPVVGVSWIQATKYAEWRTDRVNEMILMEKGIISRDIYKSDENNDNNEQIVYGESHFITEKYIKDPYSVYGDNNLNVYIGDVGSLEDRHKMLLPKYRLPTEAEWEYAALANISNIDDDNLNMQKGRNILPWRGNTTRYSRVDKRQFVLMTGDVSKKMKNVDLLANYKANDGNDGAIITNEVKSYPPNAFGLYEMSGNVSEWVADIYRPIIDDDGCDLNYFRGNIFTRDSLDSDGNIVYITDESKYDTLINGKLIPKALPGEICKVEENDKNTYEREGYVEANNIRINHDDKQSSIYYDSDTEEPMYNENNSLINDKVRVYKGGSWEDKKYWLYPAQRRFKRQDESSSSIGFRCAMTSISNNEYDGPVDGYSRHDESKKEYPNR